MATIISYKCDRCKTYLSKEEVEKKEMWEVGIHIRNIFNPAHPRSSCAYPYTIPDQSKHPVQQWCRPCVATFGLLGFAKADPGEPEKTPVTLEDTLRELIGEVVQDAMENR